MNKDELFLKVRRYLVDKKNVGKWLRCLKKDEFDYLKKELNADSFDEICYLIFNNSVPLICDKCKTKHKFLSFNRGYSETYNCKCYKRKTPKLATKICIDCRYWI